MKLWYLIFFLLTSPLLEAQKINSVSFTSNGEQIEIDYLLAGEFQEQTFDVKVYSSFDKFTKPLLNITGEANRNDILPGKKKIIWDAKKEIGLYEGDMAIKVVASVVSNYWIKTALKNATLKKGKQYEIEWGGFKPGTPVSVYLYNPKGKTELIGSYQTGQSFQWKISRGVKAGKGCYIKVSDNDNATAFAKSDKFNVKRGIPLAASVGAAAVVTGGILYLILKPEELTSLPLPPAPGK